jgi:uncharacterized protein with FMN-binding domain
MQRALTRLLTIASLASITLPAILAADSTPAAAASTQYRDGVYKGPQVDAYYGMMRVAAVVQNGQLVNVRILEYPADRQTSRYINQQAIPMLEGEVIGAQSAHVDIISGATLTSEAYLTSLNAALGQAGS